MGMFQVFSHKNFSLLFSGRVVANIGDSFYTVAAMWLVYSLGGSTFYTGLALFLTSLPSVVQFLAGPIIDRVPLKGLLIFSQFMQAGLLLVIPALYYLNLLTIGAVLVIMPLISTLNQVMYPAQFSALPKVLPRPLLTNGNSMFTLAYQGSALAFNGLAGVVVAAIGSVLIFMFNSLTFVASALIFMSLRLPATVRGEAKEEAKPFKTHVKKFFQELKEGLGVVKKPMMVRLLTGIVVINMAGAGIFAVLPGFADYQGGANVYGFYLAAGAGGMLLGALIAPALRLNHFPLGRVYATAFLVTGLCWILAGSLPLYYSIGLYFLAGIPSGVMNILAYTLLQTIVPEGLLGRVMATVFSISGVATPVGALVGGAAGTVFSSVAVLVASGLCGLAVTVYWSIDRVTQEIPKLKEIDPSLLGFEVGRQEEA